MTWERVNDDSIFFFGGNYTGSTGNTLEVVAFNISLVIGLVWAHSCWLWLVTFQGHTSHLQQTQRKKNY